MRCHGRGMLTSVKMLTDKTFPLTGEASAGDGDRQCEGDAPVGTACFYADVSVVAHRQVRHPDAEDPCTVFTVTIQESKPITPGVALLRWHAALTG